MRFSPTLSLYVVRNLLTNLFYIFCIFAFIVFIVDFLELARESQGKNLPMGQMLSMVCYKIPFLILSFLPFIFLFGSILTFSKLNNSFELAAAKSSGISIWSLCIPIVSSILILTLLITWAFQPLSAIFLDHNRILSAKYLGHKTKMMSFQSNGIWLNDQMNNPEDEKIITLKYISSQSKILSGITVYYAGKNSDFSTRYIAESASLENNSLILNKVFKYTPGKEKQFFENLSLPTNLKIKQIQENIPNPDIIPLWDLKKFIQQIKQSGFSTLKHKLYYKSILASPLLYISLVLIALACSIHLPRSGKLGVAFVTGGVIGLIIFFINKIMNVMALTGVLPVNFAILAPSISYLLLSIAALIHCEEG
jgi:lipopolysaccharide export system permease protein